MADAFDPPWAHGGITRAPTTSERENGFECGPADPALFNHLFRALQDEANFIRGIEIIAGLGLGGGGILSGNVTVTLNIIELAAIDVVEQGDYIVVHDSSTGEPRKALVSDFAADAIDLSGAAPVTRQIIAGTGIGGGGSLENDVTLSLSISELTEEATISSADFFVMHDVSAGALRKITRANVVAGLGTGGGESVTVTGLSVF